MSVHSKQSLCSTWFRPGDCVGHSKIYSSLIHIKFIILKLFNNPKYPLILLMTNLIL